MGREVLRKVQGMSQLMTMDMTVRRRGHLGMRIGVRREMRIRKMKRMLGGVRRNH